MRKYIAIILPLVAFMLTSCIDEEEYADTAKGNFEALWKAFDEHYCFFDQKRIQYGVDWNEVYTRYARQFDSHMTDEQQFEVMTRMIGELRDGHVNLSTAFDYGRNWSWYEDYPINFSENIQRNYLGTDYRIASGLYYRRLDDNVGYVYYGSFSSEIGSGNLDEVMLHLAPCNGLILDIRNNSGGQLTNAEKLAARFTNDELLVGYMQHKTGKGHNDFSKMEEQRLKPADGMRWQKKVAVLTNRSVFSAANEFVKYMKCCPNVTVIGDHTGGGAGMPFNSELPNGWVVRFSACPMYDRNKQSTEEGIDPDIFVNMTAEDEARGEDTIIEYARKLLR
ncbi:MAG: S41 family peptidase [Prevotella sp.]|nr:S41 family peptidase [Prevotella sp.]